MNDMVRFLFVKLDGSFETRDLPKSKLGKQTFEEPLPVSTTRKPKVRRYRRITLGPLGVNLVRVPTFVEIEP